MANTVSILGQLNVSDGLGTKGFPKHYGFTEADLLEDVKRLTQTDC